jgi:uncharacterized membrane protein/Mg-chelatase subunit ChlD
MLAFFRFELPGFLALLAVLPLLLVFSIRSLAGLGGMRRILAIAMRCAVVLCMVLALAGMQRSRTREAVSVLFLLDRSNSIPREHQQRAFEFIKAAEAGRRPDDRIGVIAFDGRTAVEQLPMGAVAIDKITEPVDPEQTDIAAALRLAMALFPPDAARRVVLLSDGNETTGRALDEAEHYRASGVPIDIVPILYEHANEVVFEQLRAPAAAAAEETVNLHMILRSEEPVAGRIKLEHNGQLLDLDPDGPGVGFPVQLEAGANRFVQPVPLRVAGAHRFRAIFEPDDPLMDTVAANNEGQAFTVVTGLSRVLVLTTLEDLARPAPAAHLLAAALEREQLVCDVEVAGEHPVDQVRLLEYSAVVLSNVPAGDLSAAEHRVLAAYVEQLGGGLVMVGGDNAFGAGGWLGSPVEQVMPVRFDVKNIKQVSKGALVLVMHSCEVPQGNYIGERAAIAAVKTLSSRDLIGVLSWQYRMGGEGHWTVPLQPVGDKTAVIQRILRMEMGDMPDLDEIMRAGVEALINRPDAAAKHMIIISDFDPAPPRDDLIRTMKQNKITCSTVAIGYGGHWINEALARDIADSTGGQFYRANDYSKVPQIFVKESRVVQRSLIDERTFQPLLRSALPETMAGLMRAELPVLDGIVLTTAKPLARVPLVRELKSSGGPAEQLTDPLLAYWHVGLGKTVAFTSGMWSKWGSQWVAWPQFSKFWAQLLRWCARQAEASDLAVTTSVHGDKGRIHVEARDANFDVIDFMDIQGVLIAPDQETRPIQLVQIGPGRYEAEFNIDASGTYLLNLKYDVTGRARGATGGLQEVSASGMLRTGVAVAYSPEYRNLRPNLALLDELRARTGGRRLDGGQPGAALDRGALAPVQARASVWEDLVRWALLLFLLDVAIRRIAMRPKELAAKGREYLADMAGRGRTAEAPAAVLTTLKGARGRRQEQATGPTGPGDRTAREGGLEVLPPADELARTLGGAGDAERPVVVPPKRGKQVADEASYTERLLRAKRRARDDMRQQESAEDQSDAP